MKRYIVICNRGNGDLATKVFNSELEATIYDWELRMQGYKSRIEEYKTVTDPERLLRQKL